MEDYRKLVAEICDAVRLQAQSIQAFQKSGNGTIRITVIPECREADDWLGGLGDFSEEANPLAGITRGHNDVPRYEYVFTVVPGSSHVITTEEDGQPCEIDCYGYSALKTADCMTQDGGGQLSGRHSDSSKFAEGYGYAPYLGALCIEVKKSEVVISEWGFPFCKVYICVSGAKQHEDLACSFAGIKVVKKFFLHESRNFEFLTPTPPDQI